MTGYRAILNLRGPLRDHHHPGDLALSIDSALGSALGTSRTQAAGQFAA